MDFTPYNPYNRYRQRFWQKASGMIFSVVLGMVFISTGFWLGKQGAVIKMGALKSQIESLEKQAATQQQEMTDLRTEAHNAALRLEQLRETYAEIIPEGPMEMLVTLVRDQINEGMDPERLAFVIRSARPPQNCSEAETKRFVISTPAYSGPDSSIQVDEAGITIKGTGESVKNEKGEAEAWFDPSKPVGVDFMVAGVAPEKKTGVMPLHHSVVVGAREYRFTIEEGARSFAKVTFDSCDYP